MTTFIQLLLAGLTTGAIYGLVALGFVVIYKASGIFNLAIGEFLLVGAFFAYSCMVQWQLPVWSALVFTALFSVIFGLLIERISIRPLKGQSTLTIIMMTIALSLMLRGVVYLTGWGIIQSVYPPFIPTEAMHFGNVVFSQQLAWCFAFAILAVIVLSLFFQYTKSGLRMRAVSEDHQVAQGVGIKIGDVFALTWVIAAIVCAFGGVLLGSLAGVSMHLHTLGLRALPVVIVGGLESILGALVAGMIVGLAETLATGYLDPIIGAGSASGIPYIIMVLILLVRPYGLFGRQRIERI